MNRDLSNTNPNEAKANNWVIDIGDPSAWECVCKTHNDEIRIMKSTKRMKVNGGWLYQVTTESPLGLAESLAFVPE